MNPGSISLHLPRDSIHNCEIFKKQGLHFVHLNVNSLLPKIDEIRLLALNSKPQLISLSETKLDSTILDEEIDIHGYSIVRSDRSRNGGGVGCYVRNDISFNVNEVLSDYIENINFDILLPKTKPILIGVIYRHQDKADFNDHFSDALDKINNINNREVYILGDFNIDDKSRLAKPYKEICSLHGLKQIIHSPTRITNTTSTILDHILTNSKDKLSQSGVIDIGISDHQMKFCTIKIMQQKFFKHKYIKIRSLKNYSK